MQVTDTRANHKHTRNMARINVLDFDTDILMHVASFLGWLAGSPSPSRPSTPRRAAHQIPWGLRGRHGGVSRGRGWSERDGGPADCTAAGHLLQLQQLLADLQLAATPHHVVAHSMGGIVGALHAADPAAMTTTLTLIAPAGALRKGS